MELFGIGIFEVIMIVLIALIFLGPQDTIKAGRSLGKAVRRFFSSEEWRTLLQASREIRTIPEKLLEETGLDHPEDILPSEAEIRKEAGLDDLAQNMAEWNADLSTMKQTGQAPSETQPGQTLPPRQEIRPTGSPKETITRQVGLEDLERDLSEWKADLSAWGNSAVIIPTPQTSPPAAAQTPAVSGQAPASTVSGQTPASTVSGQTPASAEPATPIQEETETEPPAQESTSSTSPEQGQK
jgi:Sec-independent protein translocase protein TatA